MEGVAAMGDMMASSARACPWGREGTSRMVFVIEERTRWIGNRNETAQEGQCGACCTGMVRSPGSCRVRARVRVLLAFNRVNKKKSLVRATHQYYITP